MDNPIGYVGIALLVVYVAFRFLTIFGNRLWKRSQEGIHQLTRDNFLKLREENRLKLVESLVTELTPAEQRGLALNHVMRLTGYPDAETVEAIRQEVEQMREAQYLRVYGRAMTQQDRDTDALAASMDKADEARGERYP